jgi:hypothetical protein
MAPSELGADGDGLVLGQEVLLRQVSLASDLDLERRVCAQVPYPLGVRSPGGEDDRLAGLWVVAERHRDRLAPFAALAALVDDQQERVAEQPAPAVPVERTRRPHQGEYQPPRLSTKAEQRPCLARVFVGGGGHDLVTGGLKIRDSYACVTAVMCCET